MNAHGTDVGAGLHTDPKDSHISVLIVFDQFAFVACSHSKLAFDRGYQRRSLEQSTL